MATGHRMTNVRPNVRLFTDFCEQTFLFNPKSKTVSREKGRRIVYFLNNDQVIPPFPNAKGPGPIHHRDFRRMIQRSDYFLKSDPSVGTVNQLMARDDERVSYILFRQLRHNNKDTSSFFGQPSNKIKKINTVRMVTKTPTF
jgi:hypothetical protein